MGRATFVTAGEGGFNDSRKTRGAMRVLAISGSLRASSINSAVLRAAAVLAPPDVSVTVYPTCCRAPWRTAILRWWQVGNGLSIAVGRICAPRSLKRSAPSSAMVKSAVAEAAQYSQ